MAERVAIIGGEGKMGRLTATLFQRLGYEPLISDISNPETPSAVEAIQSSRIVFFSVLPSKEIPGIIEAAEEVIGRNHIILDNSSIKRPLEATFRKLDERGISVCSTHPMCKHDQPLHGQKVILMDVGSNFQEARTLAENLYQNAGMIPVSLPFESHDKSMVIVQFFPHFFQRVAGVMLAERQADFRRLKEINSPNFKATEQALWRTWVQDPEISEEIIRNFLDQEEGLRLVEDLQRSISAVVEAHREKQLVSLFNSTLNNLDPDGTLKPEMNDINITIQEILANLDVQSIIISSPVDKIGVLWKLAGAFVEAGINLNAFLASTREGVKFRIGIDEKTSNPQSIAQLLALLSAEGFTVEGISTKQQ